MKFENGQNDAVMRSYARRFGSFPFVLPSTLCNTPDTEHVSLHNKSLCKIMSCASRVCNYYEPTKLGEPKTPKCFPIICTK